MSLKKIILDIEKANTGVFEQLSDRRDLLKNFGANMAAAALPFSIGSLFDTVSGKGTLSKADALNAELESEYLEYAFYHTANNTPGLIPESDKAGFQAIELHEKGHIAFLTRTISELGGASYTPASVSVTDAYYAPGSFDFTRGGVYPVFSDYTTFLMMAQVIEDSGIRATTARMERYAGTSLFGHMQQITTTEARHAAYAKQLRRKMFVPDVPAEWLAHNFAPRNPHRFDSNYAGKNQLYRAGLV